MGVIIRRNWKTSACGFTLIALAILGHLLGLDVTNETALVIAGIGLICARDGTTKGV